MGKVVKYGNGISFETDDVIHRRLTIGDEFNEVSVELMYGEIGVVIMRHNLSYNDVAELYAWLTEWIDSFQQDEQESGK
jgi:hypothetical protein